MNTRLISVITLLIVLATKSYSQMSFGISPGIGVKGAYFGYKIKNKIVPYIGFQHFGLNYEYSESGQKYDYVLDEVVGFKEDFTFSGNLYIPTLGVKYFLKERNKLKPYFSVNVSKPIISAKRANNNQEDKNFKELIESTKVWGGEFGFGVEYFFDENFSLGGEFGLRYFHLKYKDSYTTTHYDGNEQIETKVNQNYKFSTNPTFSRISVNYYF